MILGNKTLMCPRGEGHIETLVIESDGRTHREHNTPIIIMVHLGWSAHGPTVIIKLSCPDCGWKANKEISLLKMMERTALCPTNDTSTTGLKDS